MELCSRGRALAIEHSRQLRYQRWSDPAPSCLPCLKFSRHSGVASLAGGPGPEPEEQSGRYCQGGCSSNRGPSSTFWLCWTQGFEKTQGIVFVIKSDNAKYFCKKKWHYLWTKKDYVKLTQHWLRNTGSYLPLIPSLLQIRMTFLESWEEFEKAAERLYLQDPMKVLIFNNRNVRSIQLFMSIVQGEIHD